MSNNAVKEYVSLAKAEIVRQFGINREFDLMMFERWPHHVHYRGRGTPYYCPPDKFGFFKPTSPSHCDWIVPGTM
jgi:hypothetical protein